MNTDVHHLGLVGRNDHLFVILDQRPVVDRRGCLIVYDIIITVMYPVITVVIITVMSPAGVRKVASRTPHSYNLKSTVITLFYQL